ncbi:MAG TPA: hypothetical protein VES19_14830 [Candidatus Limnocylindrales bacterium]|nr:hypothetical protein [Candidatus Limnocylindrales bacterium]
MQASPFPASVLRAPSPDATCTCAHWVHCNCDCHDAHCDPAEAACDMAYLSDDGGLTPFGCAECTPGQGTPHILGCELIGWNVPMRDALKLA